MKNKFFYNLKKFILGDRIPMRIEAERMFKYEFGFKPPRSMSSATCRVFALENRKFRIESLQENLKRKRG